ncbi:MAG: urease accessory protein UreD [Alphaproteobacteria bacterium]|nr:urease accessory protein UreD [Alphaproteobacteria bacterium]
MPSPVAALQRCDGGVEAGFSGADGVTRLTHLFQRNPGRLLFPTVSPGLPPEAVLVTVAGGLTGGDRMSVRLEAKHAAVACVTTQAAEKIYRSDGVDTSVLVDLRVGAGTALEWMPQETILFDGARLRRETRISLAPGARLLAGEITIYGRTARGERFGGGLLFDRWRVQGPDRLLWYDATRLDGDIGAKMAHPAGYAGARASATLLCGGLPGQPALALSREWLAGRGDASLRLGCSLVNGLLVLRWLSADAARLRASFVEFWLQLRAARHLHSLLLPDTPPRVWNC